MSFQLFAFLLFISAPSLASPKPTAAGPIGFSVKFDHSFYELKYNSELMTYKEDSRLYTLKVRGCNKVKVESLLKSYQALSLEYAKQQTPNQTTSNYDVNVTTIDGKQKSVARGSQFGTWLRDLPKKIMYFDAEARALCKR